MRHRVLLPLSLVAISPLVAGCGGGSPRSVAISQPSLVAYAHCMRAHGVSDFPDPTPTQGIPKEPGWIHNPRLSSASRACRRLMPAGGLGPQPTAEQTRNRVTAAIAFARCLRAHGFPRFPDPTAAGRITHRMIAQAGIDLHQPAVVQAADRCAPVTHGLITKATIGQFIAG